MVRPYKYRKITGKMPEFNFYRPLGPSDSKFITMFLSSEEFETLYLRHYLNLKQTEAAEKMAISQTTYSRIITRAYEKLTKAFVEGYAISFQTHSMDQECPFSSHKKQQRRRRRFLYSDRANDHPSDYTFSGYGCQSCGFEWADPQLCEDPAKDGSAQNKTKTCPKCNGIKTYRLLKKLSPED